MIQYNGGKYTWGEEVDGLVGNIAAVKLLLDPRQIKPFYLPTGNVKQDLKRVAEDAYMVAADFIRAIYQYALSEIAKGVPIGCMDLCQKNSCFQVRYF